MKVHYQITDRKDSRAPARFLSGEGEALLPMLELIEQAEMAVDELVDAAGRATIEAVFGQENPVQRCRNHKRRDRVARKSVAARSKQPVPGSGHACPTTSL